MKVRSLETNSKLGIIKGNEYEVIKIKRINNYKYFYVQNDYGDYLNILEERFEIIKEGEEEKMDYMEYKYGIKKESVYEINYIPIRKLSTISIRDIERGLAKACILEGYIENLNPPQLVIRNEYGLHILDLMQILEMHPIIED